MSFANKLSIIFLSLITISCSADHFIKDRQIREEVENDFHQKVKLLNLSKEATNITEVKDLKEREALMFLYAYMPLCDLYNHDLQFYYENVHHSLSTRFDFKWGKSVPDEIFRHFILPVRVNNETLDSSRTIFYRELNDRVKDLSMRDAVLEINHWCREKVTYNPSDERTSSPLASVKNATGRCGEESTFTVAALRSVGIPARQVYTPRWAHTDDNHAWVEVWVDGRWYYIGACEPDIDLNTAWFTPIVSRAMLMHTKVFGKYSGSEEIISNNPLYTEINVTSTYAPTGRLEIIVVDSTKRAISNATVSFRIYNYAEFYPAINRQSNSDGVAFASLGLGDVLVSASFNGSFGIKKCSVKEGIIKDTIVLNKKNGDEYSIDIDITPPVSTYKPDSTTSKKSAEYDLKIAKDDSIRNAYVSTFFNQKDVDMIVNQLNIPENKKTIEQFLKLSKGNNSEIKEFFMSLNPTNYSFGIELLKLLSEKDLRDTPAKILTEHLNLFMDLKTNEKYDKETLVNYVLNPRIQTEHLSSWREELSQINEIKSIENDPKLIIDYIKTIQIHDSLSILGSYIYPSKVAKFKISDKKSLDNFAIALFRYKGIPARFEKLTKRAQFLDKGNWVDIFDLEEAKQSKEFGYLNISSHSENTIEDPKFETHFTISEFENNYWRVLNFRNKEGYEGTYSIKSVFGKPVLVKSGYYLSTSGTRLSDGKVLARIDLFNVRPNETTNKELVLRNSTDELSVCGNINPEGVIDGRGFFTIIFIDSESEPNKHILRDISDSYSQLSKFNLPLVFVFTNKHIADKLSNDYLKEIQNDKLVKIKVDNKNQLFGSINMFTKSKLHYPVVVVADTFGRIVYQQSGYTIGTGETLLKVVKIVGK